MDENQNFSEENKIIKEEKMLCKKHPMLKCIFCGLMVFLGAFCAFYVVSDWHFKTNVSYEAPTALRKTNGKTCEKRNEKF